jgi:uncharacterized protein DUF397
MEATDMNWRKTTYSNGGANSCVEVASADGVLVRDSTNRDGAMLSINADVWQAFLGTLR